MVKVMALLAAKIIILLVFNVLVGLCKDNAIEFIINALLYFSLVYPWGIYY